MGQAAQVSKILIFLWHCCRKRNFPGVLKRTAATGSSSGRINRPRMVWWGRNNTRVVYGKWNNNSNVVRCGNGWVGGMIICICPQMALNRKKWNSYIVQQTKIIIVAKDLLSGINGGVDFINR